MICAKLELQVLKVGRCSIGWFMLQFRYGPKCDKQMDGRTDGENHL